MQLSVLIADAISRITPASAGRYNCVCIALQSTNGNYNYQQYHAAMTSALLFYPAATGPFQNYTLQNRKHAYSKAI
jgi:hypothetical protein